MLNWIMAHPLARKMLLHTAAALAVCYAIRLYGSAQWEKGQAEGRLVGIRIAEEQKKAEWEARNVELAARAAELEDQAKAFEAEKAALARDLKASLEAIQAERNRNRATARDIPSDQLADALRRLSRQLAGESAQ